MDDTETEALASAFSPCTGLCEFMLTDKQAVAIGERPEGADIIVGSIQRHCWPHPMAGEFYFRGRWVTGSQAERMRTAGRKLKPRRK